MINVTLKREACRQACELCECCLIRETLGWWSCSLSLHDDRDNQTKDPEGEVTLAWSCCAEERGVEKDTERQATGGGEESKSHEATRKEAGGVWFRSREGEKKRQRCAETRIHTVLTIPRQEAFVFCRSTHWYRNIGLLRVQELKWSDETKERLHSNSGSQAFSCSCF